MKLNELINYLEYAIQYGGVVLLEDVGEEIDALFEPVLSKKLIGTGQNKRIEFNGKEIDFDPKFKFFVTTKLPKPHYSPEICV